MGHTPQWLVPSFARDVVAAGATAPAEEIRDAGRRLLDRWQEPNRQFHNLKHLIEVLTRAEELGREAHDPHLVRLAAWYHGAVFDALKYRISAQSGGEDETASAQVAFDELSMLGVPTSKVHRVADLVHMLLHHTPSADDLDAAALSDADLAMLATEPQKYRTYTKLVRAEYADVDDEEFLRARAAILTRLLARKALYHSPLAQSWEVAARENITAELQRVNRKLEAFTTDET
jgi:predicted metal-dependent HD superfamily phosphohydrolase